LWGICKTWGQEGSWLGGTETKKKKKNGEGGKAQKDDKDSDWVKTKGPLGGDRVERNTKLCLWWGMGFRSKEIGRGWGLRKVIQPPLKPPTRRNEERPGIPSWGLGKWCGKGREDGKDAEMNGRRALAKNSGGRKKGGVGRVKDLFAQGILPNR